MVAYFIFLDPTANTQTIYIYVCIRKSTTTTTKYDNDQDDEELLRSIPTTGLKSDIMFTIIRNRMHEEPEIMKRLTASYQFNILLNGQPKTVWSAENKTNPTGCVYNKPFMNGKPDCMLTAEDDDLIKLMFGKLNPQRVSQSSNGI